MERDADGTEWWEGEDGTWWYRTPDMQEWALWEDAESNNQTQSTHSDPYSNSANFDDDEDDDWDDDSDTGFRRRKGLKSPIGLGLVILILIGSIIGIWWAVGTIDDSKSEYEISGNWIGHGTLQIHEDGYWSDTLTASEIYDGESNWYPDRLTWQLDDNLLTLHTHSPTGSYETWGDVTFRIHVDGDVLFAEIIKKTVEDSNGFYEEFNEYGNGCITSINEQTGFVIRPCFALVKLRSTDTPETFNFTERFSNSEPPDWWTDTYDQAPDPFATIPAYRNSYKTILRSDYEVTNGTNDRLFDIRWDDAPEELEWELVEVQLTVNEITYDCSVIANNSDCFLLQSGGEKDSVWERGEQLQINENGVDICNSYCIVDIFISHVGHQLVGTNQISLG